MGKRRIIVMFALLMVFWLVISEGMDLQHILFGVFLASISVWFWHNMGPRLPHVPSPREFLVLCYCLLLLVLYIIQSNFTVAKTLLFPQHPLSPVFLIMDPPIKTSWGRVLLANCITITPGTITIDVNPETGRFIVHALTDEIAIGLIYWKIIDVIRKLESLGQKGDVKCLGC